MPSQSASLNASELVLSTLASPHEAWQVAAPGLPGLGSALRPCGLLLLTICSIRSSLAGGPAPVVLPPVPSRAVQVAASLHSMGIIHALGSIPASCLQRLMIPPCMAAGSAVHSWIMLHVCLLTRVRQDWG